MRDVVCPQCNESFAVPDDLARPHCMRCGGVIAPPDTNIAADAAPAKLDVAPAGAFADYPMKPDLPERWSSWEEFRSTSPAVQRELLALVSRPLPDMRHMRVQKLPADLPADLDGWGKPLGTIEVPGDRHTELARYINCILFGGGGLAMIALGLWTKRHHRPGDEELTLVWFMYGAIGLFIGVAIWFMTMRKTALGSTLWIFEEGIYVHRYGRTKVAPWTDIQEFEASMATGRPVYWLTFAHDLSVAISVNFTPEVTPLMEYIEIRLAAAQLLRRLEAIWEGQSQRFGIVTLDPGGITAPRLFAPWAEVRRVVSDAQHLFIDWAGASEWVPLRYRDVSFPYLVMAISHVMIDEHQRFPKN